ncbi:lysophosphatidylcholine acyltransferase 1-like [Lethenteron reissneri]|uniref:lysophosphatidylcholine acyltransferase 1-like n=1 Tax=Lethenteron reissneri TaxID=7753 RepID=UPI002AB723FA|nr:lysophosphatidylcholine acyltransferase 1-like [Lethenteron reissneri]XP_061421786.1 lysophosphatidylcholine acyltransferase 1-like [Lethenteron reissneri]
MEATPRGSIALWSRREKARVVLMSVLLVPARLLLFACVASAAWALALVASVGTQLSRPPSLTLAERLLRRLLRWLWLLCGFELREEGGPPATPLEAPLLLVAPHTSHFDVIPVAIHLAALLSDADAAPGLPLVGAVLGALQAVRVGGEEGAVRAERAAEETRRRVERAAKGALPQRHVAVFLEETEPGKGAGSACERGALSVGVAAQVVLIKYETEVVSWAVHGPSPIKVLWLTMCRPRRRVLIQYLPVYSPSEEERKDPDLYANNLRAQVHRALQETAPPTGDGSRTPVRSTWRGGPGGAPQREHLLELLQSLKLLVDRAIPELEAISERVRALGATRVTPRDLAACLARPEGPHMRVLHAAFDPGARGHVDAREVLVGLVRAVWPAQHLETLDLAFQVYDPRGQGEVTQEEVLGALRATLGPDLPFDPIALFRAADPHHTGAVTYAAFMEVAQRCPEFRVTCGGEGATGEPDRVRKGPEGPSRPQRPPSDAYAYADFTQSRSGEPGGRLKTE